MRTSIFIISLILFTSCVTGQTEFKIISKQDLKEVLSTTKEEAQLVDVRTKEEFDQGAIKGAVLIDFWGPTFLSKATQELDKNKPVYLYCKVGGRSSKAAKLLVKEGFTEVYSLQGGYSDWIKKK